MREQAECRDEPAGVQDDDRSGRGTSMSADAGREIGTRSDIPVRRYGTVPLLDEGAVWEKVDARAPRTIAEAGGTAVLLVALGTAAVAGLLLYLH
jgi:hypothetical protein